MKWFWFPIGVVATSVALVAALAVFVALPARSALASTLVAGSTPWMGAGHAGPWGRGGGMALPAQLRGLADVPADQRFGHFVGAQLNLKDKDGQPLAVTVTPGKVTAASATSLTLAANDGTTKTFALNDQTMRHGPGASDGSSTDATALATGDPVVVVTLNQSATAMAVIDGGPH